MPKTTEPLYRHLLTPREASLLKAAPDLVRVLRTVRSSISLSPHDFWVSESLKLIDETLAKLKTAPARRCNKAFGHEHIGTAGELPSPLRCVLPFGHKGPHMEWVPDEFLTEDNA